MNRTALLVPYSLAILVIFTLAVMTEAGFPLVDNKLLIVPLAVLHGLFVILALVPVRGYVLNVSILCFLIAGTIALVWKIPGLVLAEAFNNSSGIIAFIAVVPSVAIPIRIGGYIEAMEAYLSPGSVTRQPGSSTGRGSAPGKAGRLLQPFTSFLVDRKSVV